MFRTEQSILVDCLLYVLCLLCLMCCRSSIRGLRVAHVIWSHAFGARMVWYRYAPLITIHNVLILTRSWLVNVQRVCKESWLHHVVLATGIGTWVLACR
ncbi:hypothetical protein F5Y12DRAFT_739994 [Xylaria sp. FL1777]|nr:hypothetical protein F5Y12DRAFT_739994 [Xylaria sp. FL1777]